MRLSDSSFQENDLFHFEWWRCKDGYELQLFKDDSPTDYESEMARRKFWGKSPVEPFDEEFPVIQPKGGPGENYRPHVEYPGLFRRFANLGNTPEEVLAFVNQFGFPSSSQYVRQMMPADSWSATIQVMKLAVDSLDQGDRRGAAQIFNNVPSNFQMSGQEHLIRGMQLRIDASPKTQRFGLNVRPADLLSAMYLQLANEITNGINYKKCKYCPNWFPYGPGTGHKQTKEFCSTRCRVGWNRQKKRGS